MKIFLNDRIIEFVQLPPENPVASHLVIENATEESLRSGWEDFWRYEKYKKMFIIDSSTSFQGHSAVFDAFTSLFKFVPAAGGMVKNERDEILFIHRLGFWDLPKGKIDKKDIPGPGFTTTDIETARIAAIREVKEETGLKRVAILKELAPTWHIYFAKEKFCLKKTCWFEMKADSAQTLKPATQEGIFLVKWTPADNIHCILSHTYASIRELLLEVVF